MKRSFLYFSGILIALLVIILISVISSYNSLVRLNENRLSAWGNVEAAYQRRSDLIPNLVNVVKGAASFEQETLTKVIEARAKATSVTIKSEELNEASMQKFKEAQEGLNSALARLMVVVEKYPELKSNENFLQLQSQLEGTENRISVERRNFNETVKGFNTMVRRFPESLIAGFRGFREAQYFESVEGSDKAPQVKF